MQERLLDTRDMPLPEPMLAVLSALDELPPATSLRLITVRDPVLLYPLLNNRGFRYRRLGLSGRGWEVLIWHDRDELTI